MYVVLHVATYTKLGINETKQLDMLYYYGVCDTPRSEGISSVKLSEIA